MVYRPRSTRVPRQFSRYDYDHALATIVNLHNSMMSAIAPKLTDNEMLSVIGLNENTVHSGYSSSFTVRWTRGVRLSFNLVQARSPQTFYEFNDVITDPDVVSMLNTWIAQRAELNIEFGRLQAVVRYMLKSGNYNRKEVRYFFPGILSLVKSHGMEDLVVPAKNKLVIGYALRRAIEKASLTLASALMFQDFTSSASAAVIFSENQEFNEEGFVFNTYERYY